MSTLFHSADVPDQKQYGGFHHHVKCAKEQMIYLIGSLREKKVPEVAKQLRQAGVEVFDDWYAAGPEADDFWKQYEQHRGRTYSEALSGAAARNVFQFDKTNLDRSEGAILVLPAGKSGHLELGYCIGSGKPGYILLDSPERWDVMYQFATLVTEDLQEIINACLKSTTFTTETSQQMQFTWGEDADPSGETPLLLGKMEPEKNVSSGIENGLDLDMKRFVSSYAGKI